MKDNLNEMIKNFSTMAENFEVDLKRFKNKLYNLNESNVYNDKYSALDIAAYIINKSIDDNNPVSNLKLQKLLYYVQAASLVFREKELFYEDIKAWQYGPVVESVYLEYKYYSRYTICEKRELSLEIDIESKELIDEVLKSKAIFTAYDLVRLTHEESPWKNTYLGETIKKDSIKEYFENHKERIC